MNIENLDDLFEDQLRDILYAEKKITKAIAKMIKSANSPELKKSFTKHGVETLDQISKLEAVMTSLEMKIKAQKCEAIEGILKEADEIIASVKDPQVMDAALILAAQKVEHYEIATYGCLCAFAQQLGYSKQAKILMSILDQEKAADTHLSELAQEAPALNEMARAA
jgi:ferritin-like metal-binding protein YciE